ncbi:hypothetical protein F4802DRAFT_571241 [Xylaria palmicola]|nr:hypothetical protein F4802DRAFT_571241 [Xylaria palmicola]
MRLSYAEQPHYPPPGFRVRDAELRDVKSLTSIWYTSFNPSHPFFDYATPDTPATRKWLEEFWTAGIAAGPEVTRTFVVEDLAQENKVVAFSRWHVPQADGNQDSPKPKTTPAEWDPEVTDALWGGMARSRRRVMGQRPHWGAEFIAISQTHQGKKLPYPLLDWGIRQADATGLEIYGDASMRGLPVWKHYGFKDEAVLEMPIREGAYGAYQVVPITRAPKERALGRPTEKL